MGVTFDASQTSWISSFTYSTQIPIATVVERFPNSVTFDELSDACIKYYALTIADKRREIDVADETLRRLMRQKPITVTAAQPVNSLRFQQRKALAGVNTWLKSSDSYYVLKGFAGTGKTFMLETLAQQFSPLNVVFTAPTNKATKVLRTLLTRYKCKTIYSVLGLKMEAREDKLVLSPALEKPDLSCFNLVVVDEASMLNKEVLAYIAKAVARWSFKVLFVGDPAQLPPVGEESSPVWALRCSSSTLTKVIRHDNQILELVTHIRKHIVAGTRLTAITLSESGDKSVWQLSSAGFAARIRKYAAKGFSNCRVIAWRNVTVDEYNAMICGELYTEQQLAWGKWLAGDQVVVTSPIEDCGRVIATTDDEGIIKHSSIGEDLETGFKCYHVQLKLDDGPLLYLRVIHEDSLPDLESALGFLAHEARQPGKWKSWKKFWNLRHRFHAIRHSSAITGHRSQGSSIEVVFVDASDILRNTDHQEALRCLYVAASRPSTKLFITGLPQ